MMPKILMLTALYVAPAMAFADHQAIHLELGQSHAFRIAARQKYNASQLMLQAGAHYEFRVVGTWTDAKIRCNASGWTESAVRPILRPLIRAAEKKRRCRCANWFELIGTIGCNECHHFRIGCRGNGWSYTPTCNGPLYAFANDLSSKYGNNSGCLTVTVTRVAESGKCLPSCR